MKLRILVAAYAIIVAFTYGHAAVSFRAQYPDSDRNDNRAEIQAIPVAFFAWPLYWSLRLNERIAHQQQEHKP